jgi:hypothetical protein
LELGQVFEAGLATRAELFIDLQKISYRGEFLGGSR